MSYVVEPEVAMQKIYGIAKSPRPFLAKGSRSKRCKGCHLQETFCICEVRLQCQQSNASETPCQIWLVMHRKELFKPTNTGRLIKDVLPANTKVFQWDRVSPDEHLLECLNNPRFAPCLVFPDDGVGYEARVVKEWPATKALPTTDQDKIPAYILLDGTWRQARKMFRSSEFFQSLPVFSLNPKAESSYRLRASDNTQHLCTAEVAMALLEYTGAARSKEALEKYYAAFNAAYSNSRRLSADIAAS